MLTHELLLEHFVNVFTTSAKEKYIDQVWDLLQKSYAKIGGLKSGGLETKDGLVENSVMWKLLFKGGDLKVVFIYKDKGGRKKIATGTDGSREAKHELVKMLTAEFERSYTEVSDDLERFLNKNCHELVKKYQVPYSEVVKIVKDEVRPGDDDYHYQREIHGDWHTKLMIGTPGKAFR